MDIKKLLDKSPSKYQKFHQVTKLKKHKAIPASDWPAEWTTVFFKEYPRLDTVVLPKPNLSPKISLTDVLKKRKSTRSFSKTPLSLEEVSTLLYYSAGYKSFTPPWRANRYYPSGGSRYPLEVYLISLNSELGKAVYHYNVREHALELLLDLDNEDVQKYFIHQKSNESLIIVFTAIFNRTIMKYGDRGYRYVISETGNLAQNFYLVGTGLNIGSCSIGYIDDKVNELLDIDGIHETVVYAMIFGTQSGNV